MYKRKGLPGAGSQKGKVVFILDAPSRADLSLGNVLTDNYGRFFSWALGEAGLYRYQVWVTSLNSQGLQGFDKESMIDEEMSDLRSELKYLKDRGYRVIVPLGEEVTRFFGITGKYDDIRGSIVEKDEWYILPTYHPGDIHSKMYTRKRDGSKTNMKYVWIGDLRKAKEISQTVWTPPKENFNIYPTLDDLREWVKKSENSLVAVDIETTGFNRDHAEIVMIGTALSGEDALCVPLLEKVGGSYWSISEREEVRRLLELLLCERQLLFQNALFDVPFLQENGYEVPWKNVVHDTMLLHHALNPELPHKLGFIVSVYGNTPYWKEDFLGRTGSILEMQDDEVRTYNLRDSVVLHQVLKPMLEELEEENLQAAYRENMSLLAAVSSMTKNGVGLNPGMLKKWARSAKKEHDRLEQEMREIANLPPAFNFSSAADKAYLFFGTVPKKFDKLVELREFEETDEVKFLCENPDCQKRTFWAESQTRALCPKCNVVGKPTNEHRSRARRSKDTQAYRDLIRLAEVAEGVTPLFIPPRFEVRTTDSNNISVGSGALLSLQNQTQNRLAVMKRLKTRDEEREHQATLLLDFLQKYTEWSKLHKNITSYSSFPLRQDGRVHPSFLIHGTATGRLSCSSPNLQQIPKKMKGIRDAFVAPPGRKLVSADYQNLEVHVLAYETNDAELIRMIKNGINIHDENTKILFGISEDDNMWELARRAAKIFQFGGLSYGGGDREIHEKIILEVPKLGLTMRDYREAKRRWMEKHPGYAEWADRVKATALTARRSENWAGRVRILNGKVSDILKQALNTPIQGGAGSIINRAMVRIYDRLCNEYPSAMLLLQIHDQLIVECDESDLPGVTSLMREEMQAPVNFHHVPRSFPVDVEVGDSWGKLEEYKE